MAKKFGLGGGASALFNKIDQIENSEQEQFSADISNAASLTAASSEIETGKKLPDGIESDENGQLWVRTDLLKPNPHQPREEFDEEKLQELADSIKEHGILQPITIEDAEDGFFYIIAGERRTRASKLAGLEKVPVQIKHFSEQKKLEIALIENIQRADLNAVEEAKAYYKLMEISGLSQEQVAARVGKNRSTVANAVRLLKLPEDILGALSQNKITSGHARAILSVTDPTEMRILYGKIIGNGMNVREAEKYAAELNDKNSGKKSQDAAAAKKVTKDPNIIDLETKFIEKFGTKVEIKGDFDKGSIELHYFSKDDLNRLYDLMIGTEN